MSKRLLWGMITILLVTNIASIIILTGNKGDSVEDIVKESDIPKEVANIGGKAITAEEWIEQLQATYGETHLKSLINEKVVFQLAEENNLAVDEDLINKELATIETTAGVMTAEEREKNREKWTKTIRYEMLLDKLLTRDIIISEGEITKAFSDRKEQYEFPRSYQLSQIIVSDQNTAETVINELNNGQSFQQLAKEYSIDPYTKANGGYLGYFPEDNNYLQNIYYTTVNNMEEDSYSRPFQTGEGTVILYLHHILPEIQLGFDDAKDHVRSRLALEQIATNVSPEILWEELGVSWIYGE
jgi:foldase protein PrsA